MTRESIIPRLRAMGLFSVDIQVMTIDRPGAPFLIGAQTLETFGLGVDPLGRRLIPFDAYLAGVNEALAAL